MQNQLKKKQEILNSHLENKPKEVQKPDNVNSDTLELTEKINNDIEELDLQIANSKTEKLEINININELKQFLDKYNYYKEEIEHLNLEAQKIAHQIGINDFKEISINFDCSQFTTKIEDYNKRLLILDQMLQENSSEEEETECIHLYLERQKLVIKKAKLLENAQLNEIRYENYLKSLKEWEQEKEKIFGKTSSDMDSISYYNAEIEYVQNELYNELEDACNHRKEIVKNIFEQLLAKMRVYTTIYAPVEKKLQYILKDNSDDIKFETVIKIDKTFADKFLFFIKQNVRGLFYRDGKETLNSIIREVDLSSWDGIDLLIGKLQNALSNDIDNINKMITNVAECYNYLNKLEYLNVTFTLKMNDKTLDELSPGQRGIVLLIFYLALSHSSEPIIIDQPEDNLDNQSVYKKLVPCIIEAKKNRQVFIVTHNPNIAIACDAEQIICADMDKTTNKISYISGSIENDIIKQKVVDILEGTEPAFTLRKHKYFN